MYEYLTPNLIFGVAARESHHIDIVAPRKRLFTQLAYLFACIPTTWAARNYMAFVAQRISVAAQISMAQEIAEALGLSVAADPRE